MGDYTFEKSLISVSDGESLSGFTQGDGSHLVGKTTTLDCRAWKTVEIKDNAANFKDNDGNQRLDGAQSHDGCPNPTTPNPKPNIG